MRPVQFYASIANQMLSPTKLSEAASVITAKPPVALEISAIAPFDFAYAKVRVDTGETVWRWPNSAPAPRPQGGLLDIIV